MDAYYLNYQFIIEYHVGVCDLTYSHYSHVQSIMYSCHLDYWSIEVVNSLNVNNNSVVYVLSFTQAYLQWWFVTQLEHRLSMSNCSDKESTV